MDREDQLHAVFVGDNGLSDRFLSMGVSYYVHLGFHLYARLTISFQSFDMRALGLFSFFFSGFLGVGTHHAGNTDSDSFCTSRNCIVHGYHDGINGSAFLLAR